jgi:hypothetical protein
MSGDVGAALIEALKTEQALRRNNDRLRRALVAVRDVLRLYDRSALEGNNILDDGIVSAGYIIDCALDGEEWS